MKAITFLGFTEYQPTKYQYGDKIVETAFFPYALSQFFEIDELLVLVTDKVKNERPKKTLIQKFENVDGLTLGVSLSKQGDTSNFQQLCELFSANPIEEETDCCQTSNGLKIRAVDIPDGKSSDELWRIFEKMTTSLKENDKVVFDITYGFRSLPVLSFLAISYLRLIKSIKLEGIVYGAFDAKQNGITPVFDLTPFLNLLEWTTATDQFVKTGNAESLSKLIRQTDTKGETKLQELSKSINKIAVGLNTLRPLSVMEESVNLSDRIQEASEETKANLPQLVPLLEKIEKDYSQFALVSPKSNDIQTNKKRLVKHLRMVEWYEKRERWIQALSLARESIVSLICLLLNKDALKENDRARVGKLINKFYSTERGIPYKADWENALDENLRESLHKLWGNEVNRNHFGLDDSQPDLASLRNDVLHAGQVDTSKPVEQTIEETKQILREFKKVVGEIIKNK